MAAKHCAFALFCLAAWTCEVSGQAALIVPHTKSSNLNGQMISLPEGLAGPTVLILGFGRHSQDATTAWERPVRTLLAASGTVSFYDMAMITEVPSVLRSFVVRAIRHQVPDVLKPNFLLLTDNEEGWKKISEYSPAQAEAAYIMLVDRSGRVRWSTHAPFSPANFAELRKQIALISH